jgi:hypothetical protein
LYVCLYLSVMSVAIAQEPCPAGQFQSGEYCEMCPWGKFSEISGATSSETCLFCEPGQYSDDPGGDAAWTRCLQCPGNSSSDPWQLSQNNVNSETETRAQTQCACNVGYAQNEDYRNYDLSEQLGYRVFNDLCVPCMEGTYQPKPLQFSYMTLAYQSNHWQTGEPIWVGTCIPCPSGKVATPGSAYCKCPEGYAGSHDGPCTLCGEGFYSHSQGNVTVCDACPEGTAAGLVSNVWTCAPVQAAETTQAETTPAETTPAETTPAETTQAETTPAETTPAETTPAETTPAETTPPETTIITSTTPAPKSFYPLSCIGCPAGFFLSQESLNCTACPSGSSTQHFSNASSALDCLCGPGFENNTDACQLCKEGFYKQSLENVSCASCPTNSSTAFPGALNESECVCKPGYTQRSLESNLRITPTPTPAPAPAPTLQFFFRTDESPYSWQEAYDEASAAGRRLPTFAELNAYIISNPSEFTQWNNQDRWTPVVNPAVENTKDFVQIGQNQWAYRGMGLIEQRAVYPSWADDSTFHFMQVYTEVLEITPPKTAVLYESLPNTSIANASLYNAYYNASDCVACPAGTYKTLLGPGACVPCPVNHYCPPASPEPRACPANSSSISGSRAPQDCLCFDDLVLFESNNTYKCELCHADTYHARDPATSVGICIACHPGSGSPAGSRSKRDCVCKPGFFVEPYASEYSCTACSPGHYSAAANASVCDSCAPGSFASTAGAAACSQCPSGSVALVPGMSACVPCPVSTWQNVELPGHLSTACLPCPANSGHQLTGIYDVFKCDCDPGLYKAANQTPGAKNFVCSSCEPGFQCAAGTSSAVSKITLLIDVAVSEFTPALKQAFTESIAHTSGVEPELVSIVSVKEHISRRLLSIMRRLLSGSSEVEFEITYLNVNNASSVIVPTLEQFAADAEDRELPVVQLLIVSQLVVYDQRIPCEQGKFCGGGEQVFSCRIFSSSLVGALTQADCACVPGFFSLNTTAACNKCPPGNYCVGGLVVKSCAPNSTSAPGAGSADACYCRDGHWRGCTRTKSGKFINNTAQACTINFTTPCVQCRANDICFNDTLLHCPDHSTSPPGSSEPSHCICDGGYAVEYLE